MKFFRFISWLVWDLVKAEFIDPIKEDFDREWERFKQYEARKKLDKK